MPGSVHFVELAGLRVLSAEDTWASLASVLGLADLVAAGDFLVTPPFASTAAPPTSTSELARVAAFRFALDYHGAPHRSARQHAKDVARDDLARAYDPA